MLKKLNRFTDQTTIKKLMSSRQQHRAQGCSLKYMKNQRHDFRLAVVVSKKTAKSAVVRNRIRRRVFAWAKTAQLPPLDLVIFVYNEDFATLLESELRQRLDQLSSSLKS